MSDKNHPYYASTKDSQGGKCHICSVEINDKDAVLWQDYSVALPLKVVCGQCDKENTEK